MTTETQETKVQTQQIDLEELGRLIGVPIKVKPWWGSRRGYKWSIYDRHKETGFFHKWFCAAPGDYYAPTPPRVNRNWITVYSGQCGIKCGKRTHKHRQWVNVLAVQPSAMLVEVFAGTDRYSRSQRFILGVDGRPYVAGVGRVNNLDEAFESLKPAEVRKAEAMGLTVKRQGDWFFIPTERMSFPPKVGSPAAPNKMSGKALYGFPVPWRPTRHYAEEIVHSLDCRHAVRGEVRSPDHGSLFLEDWHIAIRNRDSLMAD